MRHFIVETRRERQDGGSFILSYRVQACYANVEGGDLWFASDAVGGPAAYFTAGSWICFHELVLPITSGDVGIEIRGSEVA